MGRNNRLTMTSLILPMLLLSVVIIIVWTMGYEDEN
jgi:hypothetical protein